MPTIIALLRGVNVTGNNMIRMEVLRSLCSSLGCSNVKTYLQSGNVVFTTRKKSLPAIARGIESAIEQKHGFRSAVILRTPGEMAAIIKRNPFAGRNLEPSKFVVVFLPSEIPADKKKEVEAIKVGPEEIRACDRELYIYYPDGQGRSKLGPALDRVLKIKGTARNWNSVTKLKEMADEISK